MPNIKRMEKALAMQRPDRMPFSLWMHFPNNDRSPRRLAEMTLYYQRELDLDYVKFMPYGLFSCFDYGLPLKVFPGFYDAPVAEAPLITKPHEWNLVRPLSGNEGEYAVILESLRLFLKETRKVPVLMTVFSPLTTAAKLTTEGTLLAHVRNYPEQLRKALEIITETTIQWANALLDHGSAGIFMGTQMSLRHQLTIPEHREFVRKYDLAVLDAIKGKGWCNVYHMHGEVGWLEEFGDYPVQALSWHDRDGGPDLAEARKLVPGKCFCCGLSHRNLAHAGTDAEVAAQVRDAWTATNGEGILFAPGCVLNPRISMDRLRFIARCAKDCC